jgi:hypothetical protein
MVLRAAACRRGEREARWAKPHKVLQARARLQEEETTPTRMEAKDRAAVGGGSYIARVRIAPKVAGDRAPVGSVVTVREAKAPQSPA